MPPTPFVLRELAAAVQEPARISTVRETGLLDAPRSVALDRLTQLTKQVMEAPMVSVTLVDGDRDWIVSAAGLPEPLAGTRDLRGSPTLAQYAVATRDAFAVEDVANHPTFSTFPRIAESLKTATPIASCAVAPLITSQGHVLGAVCAIDHQQRSWSPEALDRLNTLAAAMVTEIELRTVRKAAERSTHRAMHDPLTGLPNRTLFLDRVDHARARAERGEHIAVLFLDLDGFKEVNDQLGHAEGDALLQAVATRLRQATRTADTVARLGGDEFAVLLEVMSSEQDAMTAAARITTALQEPVPLNGRNVAVRASIGIAHSRGTETVEQLLHHADLAMYRAKRAGGTTVVFEPAMQAALADRLQMSSDVRRAIEGKELHLLYQPIVDLARGVMRGVEALARWQHPKRGAVSPSAFIPAAEESDAILDIGRWTLEEACAQLQRWDGEWRTRPLDDARHRRYGRPAVHVNISTRHLQDARLVRDVEVAITRTGIAPERVVLEIPEIAMLQRNEHTGATLQALKQLGVRIAVDDFGTGDASLYHLQRLPVDILKVDKRFVAGLGTGTRDAGLARGIVALGEALGLHLSAEGVESQVQRRELRVIGCEMAQGYLFAPPLPAAQVVAWASAHAAHWIGTPTPAYSRGLGFKPSAR